MMVKLTLRIRIVFEVAHRTGGWAPCGHKNRRSENLPRWANQTFCNRGNAGPHEPATSS